MRVKKLTGTYVDVCNALAPLADLGFQQLIQNILKGDEYPATTTENVCKDIGRSPIYGNFSERILLQNAWKKTTAYTQGDFYGGLNITIPFAHSVPVDPDESLVCQAANILAFNQAFAFAYWSDDDQACGVSLIYKHQKPQFYSKPKSLEENWMCCVIRNSNASLNERNVTIYFSEALCERFSALSSLSLSNVDFYVDLQKTLHRNAVFELLQNSVKNNGKVNLDNVKKIDTPTFPEVDGALFNFSMKILDSQIKFSKITDSICVRKSHCYGSIISLVGKYYDFHWDDLLKARYFLGLANRLFEKCEPMLSLESEQFIEANWSKLEQECQLLIEAANQQLVDFKLPELFFKLDILYIELYCKRSKLLCENNPASFRKAQVYDQLMSMVDSVQQLEEEFHFEDAVRLFTLVTQLKRQFEALLSVSEDQILAHNWDVLHKDCHRSIADAKKNLSHYKVLGKWGALDFTYLEIHALKIAFKKSYKESKNPSDHKKAKVCKHLLELLNKADAMRRSDYRDDAEGAIELALKLTETCKPYLTATSRDINWKQLKKDCKAIISDAEYQLAYYGFFQMIITNLLLAITGLCLLKAAFTGSFFVHNPGEECFQEFQETASAFKNSGLISG